MESQHLQESQENVLNAMFESLKENIDGVTEYLSTKKDDISDMSKSLATKADEVSDMTLRDIGNAVVDATSKGFENADNNITGAVNTVKEVGSDIVDGGKLAVDATVDAATYVAEGAKNAYDAQVQETADFYEGVDQTYTAVKEGTSSMYASTKQGLGEAYDVVAGTLQSVPDVTLGDVGNTIADAGSYVKDGFTTAYDVTAGTIESVPNVTVGDVGNTIADAGSYIADAIVGGEAMAAEAPIVEKKGEENKTGPDAQVTDKGDFKNNVDKISSFMGELEVPTGYNLKITDGVVGVFKNGGERIRYFTPDKAENANLLDKASVQNWINTSVQNFEKRYYNKK